MGKHEPKLVKCYRVQSNHIVWIPEHIITDKVLKENGLKRAEPEQFNPSGNFSAKQEGPKPLDTKDESPDQEDEGSGDALLSKDMKPATKAIKHLESIVDPKDVEAFLEGETRKGVLSAAEELNQFN